jgi:hypothetical protein
MENQVPPRDRERVVHLDVRTLAFVIIVVGLLVLRILLAHLGPGEHGSAILIGGLLGAAVAALFGLANWHAA